MPPLDGLRVVRAGWFPGEAGPQRFEPSQALAMGLCAEEALLSLRFRSEDDETLRYLKGETLHIDASCLVRSADALSSGEAGNGQDRKADRSASNGTSVKGYVLVCEDGYPIGWGKYSGDGMLKNELAAGWRWI
ncbi:RsmF rRNA methyltransferase first C-terminal domain-containing protein [Paenibacillus spongiae]|uniref:RsmF rRNA methyltransferase first C-terminal domain-containing protein n=1 Tax=Paenibacillus spongiae TaxID=2909671 RepID=UPI00283A9CC6|nr:RsmF rRNA methyltransferase first C-terminal domain-containing protein [Paenibacillus spongiae]